MSTTEKLIEVVKQYPLLYKLDHPDYRNNRKKDHTWDIIGKECGSTGETIKKKWKNLRDTYSKYLRSLKTTTGQGFKKNYKEWQWANAMESFKPFLAFANTESNISYSTTEGTCDANTKTVETMDPNLLNQPLADSYTEVDNKIIPEVPTKRKRTVNESKDNTSVDKVLEYFENKRRHTDDPIDLIFLGYAKTVKSFSPRRQIITKMKIAEVIMNEELENLNEQSAFSGNDTKSVENSQDSEEQILEINDISSFTEL